MYSYVVSLTKEEALEGNKEAVAHANKWWESLSGTDKVQTADMLSLMYIQVKCQHKWVDGLYYDIPTIRCSKCDLTK